MEIFLKKKLKRGNLAHKKQQTTPCKDPQFTSITAIQCKISENGNQSCSNDKDCKKTIKGSKKRRNLLPKTFGAIMSNACGSRRKEQEVSMCTIDEAKECMEKMEAMIIRKCEFPPEKSHSSEETKGVKVEGENRKKLSLSRMFGKSSGFGFGRWKAKKTGYSSAANGTDNKGVILKTKYVRISSLKIRQKRDVKEEGIGELELCKKRILMGEKCRPLNPSGVLHYDKDGVLLPEDALAVEESYSAIAHL